MATALTPGFIYLIESETGVDDWITDHSGDPDLIDLDNFSVGNNSEEGVGFCKIEFPQQFKKNFTTGIIVQDVSGAISFERRWEKRAYAVLSRGINTTRANADLVEKFLTMPRHTAGSLSTYNFYYLIIYFGVNDHVPFTDQDGNRKSYCKGVVTSGSLLWNEKKTLIYTLSLNWRSVW